MWLTVWCKTSRVWSGYFFKTMTCVPFEFLSKVQKDMLNKHRAIASREKVTEKNFVLT